MVCYNQAADMTMMYDINLEDRMYVAGKIYYDLKAPNIGRGSGTPFLIVECTRGDKIQKEDVLLYGEYRHKRQKGEPAKIQTSRIPRAA